MKTILTMIALLFIGIVSVNAQQANSGNLLSASNGTALDTVTNTATKTQSKQIGAYQDVVSIQATLAKQSGTAAGVVKLYGSLDGVSYSRIGTDSLAVANVASQSKIFTVSPSAYSYYQISYTGSGTQAVTLKSFAIWRRHN